MRHMLRIGYPAKLAAELLSDFPPEVELVPLPDQLDSNIGINVWIPDPYPTLAMKVWPHLRGVRLVLSLMAGTEWIPGTVGPHVTICNAHGAHNISTAEWTLGAILATLKHLPLFLDVQRSGQWKRRFEACAQYADITGDNRPLVSAGHGRGIDRQGGSPGGLRRHRQGNRAHDRAFSCAYGARGPQRSHRSRGPCRKRTG